MTGLELMRPADLARDVEVAIEEAIAAVMTRDHPDLPSVWWSAAGRRAEQWGERRRQVVAHPWYDTTDAEAARLVRAWSQRLRLARVDNPGPGILAYSGDVDGIHVTMWGVVDRQAWELGR